MISKTHAAIAIGLAWGSHQLYAVQEEPGKTSRLTIEQLIHIKHPSDPIWSPDGKYVAFVWDQGGVQNLYRVSTDQAKAAPISITAFTFGQIEDAFWAKDSKSIYFSHEGSLWQAEGRGTGAHSLSPAIQKGRDFDLSPSGTELAYVAHNKTGDDLMLSNLQSGKDIRIGNHSPR